MVNAVSLRSSEDSYYQEYIRSLRGRKDTNLRDIQSNQRLLDQLVKDPTYREQMFERHPAVLQSIEEQSKTDPAKAQVSLARSLDMLNYFKAAADWGDIDPAFGKNLNTMIHNSNALLNKIEIENPKLRPRGSDSVNLLIRSETAREEFIDAQRQLHQNWEAGEATDPKHTYYSVTTTIKRLKEYQSAQNWFEVDSQFALDLSRSINNAEQVKRRLEAVHPDFKG